MLHFHYEIFPSFSTLKEEEEEAFNCVVGGKNLFSSWEIRLWFKHSRNVIRIFTNVHLWCWGSRLEDIIIQFRTLKLLWPKWHNIFFSGGGLFIDRRSFPVTRSRIFSELVGWFLIGLFNVRLSAVRQFIDAGGPHLGVLLLIFTLCIFKQKTFFSLRMTSSNSFTFHPTTDHERRLSDPFLALKTPPAFIRIYSQEASTLTCY